jgi:NADPH2:quinone reductase
MRSCWVITEFGPPMDVLKLQSIAEPKSTDGMVIIEVDAVGLNFLDSMMARGTYPTLLAPPIIPGAEIVGRIVDPGGCGIEPGARVVAMSPKASGGLAERALFPQSCVFPLPDDIPSQQGAALLITYQTAHFALVHRGNLRKDEYLLVSAGAGGVGIAAIQLGKALGAKVIATAGSPEKVQVCLDEGADLAINYRREDFVKCVKNFTGGEGANLICDMVGGEMFRRSLECLAFDGRIVSVGNASGHDPEVNIRDLIMANQTVIGLAWGAGYPGRRPDLVRSTHDKLIAMLRVGKISPRISKVVPFSEANLAIQELGEGNVIGKLVVSI